MSTESGGLVSEESPWSEDGLDVVLWTPTPTEAPDPSLTAEADVPPSQPSIPWQLIGITEQKEERVAALYDPTLNRLLMARLGEELQGYRLITIGLTSIQLLRDGVTQDLSLPKDGAP